LVTNETQARLHWIDTIDRRIIPQRNHSEVAGSQIDLEFHTVMVLSITMTLFVKHAARAVVVR